MSGTSFGTSSGTSSWGIFLTKFHRWSSCL